MGFLIFSIMSGVVVYIVYRYIDTDDSDHYPNYNHLDDFQE